MNLLTNWGNIAKYYRLGTTYSINALSHDSGDEWYKSQTANIIWFYA